MAGNAFRTVPLDAVREYWDRRPCNIRHSPKPVGTREYFDEVEARRYFVEPHIPAFADFRRWSGQRVLEIGCGIGTDTIAFARAGAFVTAVDVSERSLELARQRAAVFGLEDRVHFVAGNAERLSDVLPPQPYDLVYSFGVLHHTPDPDSAIGEIRRHYVHDASLLKLMLYHRYSWKVLSILLREGRGAFWKLDRLIARNSEAQTGCPVTYSYSRGQGRALLERHGFAVDSVRVDMIFPYRVEDYIQHRYVKEWYFRPLPVPVFRSLERLLGWHLCIEARPGH